MANELRMDERQAIKVLALRGYSHRRIARELGLHRLTVRRYAVADSKCTTQVPTGTHGPPGDSKCTIVPTGIAGRRSHSLAYKAIIEELLDKGFDGMRIYQDLVCEHGFEGSYDSVRRFIKKLGTQSPERVWRMECAPGEEAQVDYGTMYVLEDENGRLKKVHVLRVSLSHSRKSYSEAMVRQDTESFIRTLENAFRYFGGSVAQICLDNLKAAVTKADWYDPELNPKILAFARHYQVAIVPTRPYTPQHKGKVESGIRYVKNSALRGRRFGSIAEINAHLLWWENNVADRRIHGTTKKQVGAHFETSEKPALKPLPAGLFPCYQEGRRRVHRDSYVEVKGAYYEVGEEHIGRSVWVRWDSKMVRVLNEREEIIARHLRIPAGSFTRVLGVQGTRGSMAQSLRYYRGRLGRLGAGAGAWADALIAQEPILAIRRLQGLLSLSSKYKSKHIDAACGKALHYGHYRLGQIKDHLQGNLPEQGELALLGKHELIRDLSDYESVVGSDIFT